MSHFIPKALLIKHPFVLFGPTHLMAMAVIAVVIAALVSFVRMKNNGQRSFTVACCIAAFSGLSFICCALTRIHYLNTPLIEVLPLQLCNVLSLILIPILLINKNQTLFELAYYIGIGGSLQAIITPTVHYTLPFLETIFYYTEHGSIILGVFYCLVVYRMAPQPGSIFKTWLAINLYFFAVMIINHLIGTNFIFSIHKPQGTTFLSYLGPWPWYIISLSALAYIIPTLLYLPFYLGRHYRYKSRLKPI